MTYKALRRGFEASTQGHAGAVGQGQEGSEHGGEVDVMTMADTAMKYAHVYDVLTQARRRLFDWVRP